MENTEIKIGRAIIEAARDKRRLTYKDLASEINWGHPLGRGLGAYLASILQFCAGKNYPPLTTLVVKAGTRYPPDDALAHIRRVIGELDIESAQQSVFAFNWEVVTEFGFVQPPEPEIDFSRIFANRVWGFTPEEWGMFGFSAEVTRDRRLEAMNGAPVYVIYFCSPSSMEIDGTGGEMTIKEEDKGRMLGIAEVQPKIASPETHLAQQARDEMIRRWGKWRWQYGLEVSRAWRFLHAPWTKEALPHARSLSWEVTKDLIPLTDEEVRLVKQYAYEEVPVFGRELRPVVVALREPMHTTYLAICGSRDVLVNTDAPKGTKLVKIGVSGDTNRRLGELNGHDYAKIFGLSFQMYATKRWPSQSEALTREWRALEWALDKTKHASGEFFYMTDEQINEAVMKVKPPKRVR